MKSAQVLTAILGTSLVAALCVLSHASTPKEQADAFYARGLAAEQRGELVAANNCYQLTLRLNASHKPAQTRMSELERSMLAETFKGMLKVSLPKEPLTNVPLRMSLNRLRQSVLRYATLQPLGIEIRDSSGRLQQVRLTIPATGRSDTFESILNSYCEQASARYLLEGKAIVLFPKTLSQPEKKPSGGGPEAVEELAETFLLEKAEFKEAAVAEAFQWITSKTGIKILYLPGEATPRITLSFTNVSTADLIRFVTNRAGLTFTYEKEGVLVFSQETKAKLDYLDTEFKKETAIIRGPAYRKAMQVVHTNYKIMAQSSLRSFQQAKSRDEAVIGALEQEVARLDDPLYVPNVPGPLDPPGTPGIVKNLHHNYHAMVKAQTADASLADAMTAAAARRSQLQSAQTKYKAGLQSTLESVRRRGDAATVSSLKDELSRLETGAPIPDVNPSGTLPTLAALRTTYRTSAAATDTTAAAERAVQFQPTYDRYDASLASLGVSLAGKANDLAAVAAARSRLTAARRAAGVPPLGTPVVVKLEPPDPRVPTRASASFTNPQEALEALYDGKEPASSGDKSSSRFTWYPHRASFEWVQYDFDKPQVVEGCSVFWYQDAGGVKLPEFWRVLYLDEAGIWMPVDNQPPPPVVDTWNICRCKPVRTKGLRVAAQLGRASAGILEWKVTPSLVQTPPALPQRDELRLDELIPLTAKVGYGPYRVNRFSEAESVTRPEVVVDGSPCEHFLLTHASSAVSFAIPVGYARFSAVGIAPRGRKGGSWTYKVLAGESPVYESKQLDTYPEGKAAIEVDIPPGTRTITLITDECGDKNADHSIWAYPKFLPPPLTAETKARLVQLETQFKDACTKVEQAPAAAAARATQLQPLYERYDAALASLAANLAGKPGETAAIKTVRSQLASARQGAGVAPSATAVASAQAEAARKYPPLSQVGSAFNVEFVGRVKRYQKEQPGFFQDPAWPLKLADEVAPTDNRPPAADIKPGATPSEPKVIVPTDLEGLKPMMGKAVVVEGSIVALGGRKDGSIRYLNFTKDYKQSVSLVFSANAGGGQFTKEKLTEFVGKKVRASGTLSDRGGILEMKIDSLDQVKIQE